MRNEPKPKKSRLEKSKVKTMLICFYDSKSIVHTEFVPSGQNVNAVLFWRLLHDNAPSHRSTLVADYLTKNHILTINHSPYSPDMGPCDVYLFEKGLHRHTGGHTGQRAKTLVRHTFGPCKKLY